ncbi:MAG: hypothetical protein Q4G14_13475 [Paracoccus sp. (in: a-proteobacteria)]|uniref:hypothetical protein n=1 Tax=Paracoccus sp. TaxID=267 RepID=UPI0026DECE9F|nr:hypothetical protein [Paracoccus sp. (in: a-proteobacteria)]MDO5614235.1 hypothetical protein [Paracoccus sp. (in: a-proteobacteria)]
MRAALALALLTAGIANADPLPHVTCPGHPRCLALIGENQVQLPSAQGNWIMDLPELPPGDDPDAVITLAEDAPRWWHDHGLIALMQTEKAYYSGGGAHVETLILLRPDAPQPALSLPLAGYKTIRACFSQADTETRQGYCADEYDFDAALSTAPEKARPPILLYQTTATIFPPGAILDHDNTHLEITPDISPETVPRCTFTRSFRWNETTASYQPDTPLPDCTDFTRL